VLDRGPDTGPSHRSRHQLGDRQFQVLVGRSADGVGRTPRFQRLIDLTFGKGRVGPHYRFFPALLLPLDLGQQSLFPIVGAVHVAGPQFDSQAVAFPIEQQERVIAGGLKMSVVGALLLVAIDRDLSAVDVQHDPLR
jgi:hypothetical protein